MSWTPPWGGGPAPPPPPLPLLVPAYPVRDPWAAAVESDAAADDDDDDALDRLSDEDLDRLTLLLETDGVAVRGEPGDVDDDVFEDALEGDNIDGEGDGETRRPPSSTSRKTRSARSRKTRGNVNDATSREGPLAIVLGAGARVRDAARNALDAVRATPGKVVVVELVVATARATRAASGVLVFDAFAGCYAPRLLRGLRVAACASVAAPALALIGAGAGASGSIAARLRDAATSPDGAAMRSLRAVSPVSPAAALDVASRLRLASAARAFRACASSYARAHACLFVVRTVARKVAPRETRRAEYAVRVAPVVVAYAAKKRLIRATIKQPAARDAAWNETHAWGAREMERVICDFGGFFRKVGQIMGTAKQMMPPAYLESFSRTMDANPPTPFPVVKRVVERSLGCALSERFSRFDERPLATASIAQVHAATLRADGRDVVVKVLVADKKMMVGDVASMLHTSIALKRVGLDNGVDFPTVFRAYQSVIEHEFDFNVEARKISEFREVFETHGLSDRVATPRVVDELSGARVLVMERVRGVKVLDALNRARRRGRVPRLPSRARDVHNASSGGGASGDGWEGVFHTVFRAWGVMLLRHGHYHSDPHPGNLMLRRDGKLAILDWGQTQIAPASYRAHLCRLVIHMCAEDPRAIANEVRTRSQVKLERPTTEALTALCYAYFDTRPSALAEINMFDLNNSPFLRNKIVQNTEEGFFTIRTVFLLRGMMRACGVTASMVSSWERDARAALRELPGDHGASAVPWAITTRSKRFLSRSVLGIQRMINVGSGSRLNALEAYAATKAAEREAREDAAGEDGSPGGGKRASFFYD